MRTASLAGGLGVEQKGWLLMGGDVVVSPR